MNWALFASSGKVFVSLLLAAALIWSGVALTASPPIVDASLVPLGPELIGQIESEEEDAPHEKNGTSENTRDSGPSSDPANSGVSPQYFDTGANYRILTSYGSSTEIDLADFLGEGQTGVSFSLHSCDDSRLDYYDSVVVNNGLLQLESNTLGQVHGTNTDSETVCSVTATGDDGSESREFSLYTVSDRTPQALQPGAVTLSEARSGEIDIQIALPGTSLGYVRVGWRKSGGQPSFGVVYGATDGMVLTIPGLEASTDYEIRAYLMTAQAFDLYRASNTGSPGTLIQEGNPEAKWVSNLSGGGVGKSETLSVSTLPEPDPSPVPSPSPEATLAPTPRPTPDDDDEDDDGVDTPETDNDGVDTPETDNDGIDTPETDNDGVDTPETDNDGIDTPETDNDGIDTPETDNDGVDTPETDNDGVDTPETDNDGVDTPETDNDGIDTPETDNDGANTRQTRDPNTPLTPSPATPSPLTVSPATVTPVTVTPATPSPVTVTPVTPSPVTPSPVTPSPVTPSPVTPSPVTPSPVTPSPVTPSPVTPSPVTPSPVTPSPVTPESDSDDSVSS